MQQSHHPSRLECSLPVRTPPTSPFRQKNTRNTTLRLDSVCSANITAESKWRSLLKEREACTVIAGNVNDIESMRHFIEECGLRASDDYVVILNWLFQGNGIYKDTGTLQPVLRCLDNLTVIESYKHQQNDWTRTITPENGKAKQHPITHPTPQADY